MSQASVVLIVDDNAMGRETLEDMLYGQGYTLAFAAHGLEALKQAAELMPDIILLDVMMPGMDGFDVCRRLRADARLAEVPIVLVTALDDRASRLQGIEAGADDFISKPFDRAELRARVKTITRLNRYRRLRTEHARFRWMAEKATDGYLLTDAEGYIIYANAQARLYLGLAKDASLPTADTFLNLACQQYRCEPQIIWQDWPASAAADSTLYLVRPETPTTEALWLQATYMDEPAGPDAGHMVRLWDVTAQVSAQRDMRTFQAMVMHKLRTPIAITLMSVELIANSAHALSADEITELADGALRGIERLHSEIEDVLKFIGVRHLSSSSAGYDLAQLPALVSSVSADQGLERVFVYGTESLGAQRLWLAEPILELMLREILENSKKFHPTHSPTVAVYVTCPAPETVQISIQDNGITLSPPQLAKVWIPYYQGEKYFTGEIGGMGLGLPMVATIVWQAGGQCRLYNREDEPGVVVELTFPLSPAV